VGPADALEEWSHSDAPPLAPASTLQRFLYALAAVLGGSGVPYALTALRRTNGALSIRSKRVCGPLGEGSQPIAVTYASHEARSIERERSPEWSTRRLVLRWKWHNDIRTVMLVLGTVAGALAVSLG